MHLTVLSSTPRRTASLFPHALPIVRVWEREYLIVLSTELEAASVPTGDTGEALQSQTEPDKANGAESDAHADDAAIASAETPRPAAPPTTSSGPDGSLPPSKRVMLSALHAIHYLLPPSLSSDRARSTSLVYISKADSSGYSASPVPYTRHLITSFLSYFLAGPASLTSPSPSTATGPRLHSPEAADRVFVQLFARAQGQYLFANSSQNPGKRALKGLGLCAWWKGVYEAAAVEALRAGTSQAGAQAGSQTVRLAYLLPGYEADEADGLLGAPRRSLPAGLKWEYKPPYSEPILGALPSATSEPGGSSANSSDPAFPGLALMIPCLPDDPKTRFLDELAANPEDRIRSAVTGPSVSRTADGGGERQTQTQIQTRRERSQADDEAERRRATQILGRISPPEFWTRMGFRQEMASGDVTGFFSLVYDRPGRVGSEGGEAAGRIQPEGDGGAAVSNGGGPEAKSKSAQIGPGLRLGAGDLPHPVFERLHAALINVDFSALPLATEGTQLWDRNVKAIVSSELGPEGYAACTVEVKVSAAAAAAAQGAGGGPGAEKRKEEVVTMLQPRKKKKV